MKVDNFIFLFFCCLFVVYDIRFIYVVIVKSIVFTCVIYYETLYHQSERNIPNFLCRESCCDLGRSIPTWFQVLGQIVMHIFPVWGRSYIHLFWKIMCKLYLSMDHFGIKWTTIKIHLYLCMDVLSKNHFMSMHIYLIPG